MKLFGRLLSATIVAVVGLATAALTAPEGALAGTADSTAKPITATATGLRPGKIKNVWLIILENKSHDATFTGLNQNSYLRKALPSEGVLLQNYYGTGHYNQNSCTAPPAA